MTIPSVTPIPLPGGYLVTASVPFFVRGSTSTVTTLVVCSITASPGTAGPAEVEAHVTVPAGTAAVADSLTITDWVRAPIGGSISYTCSSTVAGVTVTDVGPSITATAVNTLTTTP